MGSRITVRLDTLLVVLSTFILLKLFGLIKASWWTVFMPLWLVPLVFIAMVIVLIIISLFQTYFHGGSKK